MNPIFILSSCRSFEGKPLRCRSWNRHPGDPGGIAFILDAPDRGDEPLGIKSRRGIFNEAAEFGFEFSIGHRARHRSARFGDVAFEPAAVFGLDSDVCRLDWNIRILLNGDFAAQIEHRRLTDALVRILREASSAVDESGCDTVLDADLCGAAGGDIGAVGSDTQQWVAPYCHCSYLIGG